MFLTIGLLSQLTACTRYHEQPLDDQTGQYPNLESLLHEIKVQQGNAIGDQIDLADGLNLTEISLISLFGNQDLRVQRAGLKIAQAQVFSTGLLPDPQLSLSLDRPTGNATGLVNAFVGNLAYDLIPLITRQARLSAQRKAAQETQLNLLWHEWQIIQQVRTLTVRYRLEQEKLMLLEEIQKRYQAHFQRSVRNLREGNISLGTNGTDLSALMDSLSQIYQLQQVHNQTGHGLRQLLGLQPNAEISIEELPDQASYDISELHDKLKHLSEVRPDLLALKAGYQSQESRLRAAILAQFPALLIGISQARDTGGIHTTGINIGLSLPLFSGNRGQIAIEQATREQLALEYQSRLAQATVEVDSLCDLQNILKHQQDNLSDYLPKLQSLVSRGRTAYDRGDIDALTFLNMESTMINKRLEQIDNEQNLWEIKIALQTLLALPEHNVTAKQSRHDASMDLRENIQHD